MTTEAETAGGGRDKRELVDVEDQPKQILLKCHRQPNILYGNLKWTILIKKTVFNVQEGRDKSGCVGALLLYTGKSRNMTGHTDSHQESETLGDESGP